MSDASYQSILTNSEIMELLKAFYSEALRFLEVPNDYWAVVKMGVGFNGTDGKASLISVNYPNKEILVCLPVLEMMIQSSPNATGDAPSVYRAYGYKLARLWQQYLTTGKQGIFEQDKDSDTFALALGIIKGLPQVENPVSRQMIQALGHNPFDQGAAIRMLRDEFGIDCCVK